MKKLIFLLFASILTTNAIAQSENSGANTPSTSSTLALSTMSTKGYNRFYIDYDIVKANITGLTFPMRNSVSFGYLHGSSLSKNIPLFLEFGTNFQYTFGKTYDDGDIDESHMYSMNLPFHLAFKIQFNNDVALTPYVGPNFRFNLGGKYKYTYEKWVGDYYHDYGHYETVLDSERMFDNDGAQRFQPGIDFGIGLSYKALYIGVGYLSDFTGLYEDNDLNINASVRFISFTLGVNF